MLIYKGIIYFFFLNSRGMRVVIIGGGAAGMSAASRIRRLKRDFEIVVFERTGMVSHAPCGIPYYLEGVI